jgi:alpha-L-rhamnosidase
MKLRCESLFNPLGIDVQKPCLSWQLAATDDTQRGQRQTAYQLLVANIAESLAADRGDLWDSGKVASDATIQIAYAGLPLTSRAGCFWKVRVWDRDGSPSPWSEPARWTMGILDKADWGGAEWIGAPPELERPFSEWQTNYGFMSWISTKAEVVKWIVVDLGSEQEIDQVKLYGASPPGEPSLYFPVRFRIDVSAKADFSKFQTVANAANEDLPLPKDNLWSVAFAPQKARYVRLWATRLRKHPKRSEFALGLAEFEVRGHDKSLSLHCDVKYSDVTLNTGWAPEFLTDGRTVGRPPRGDWKIPPSPLLRKQFGVDRGIVHAEVSVTALGEYELRINGQRVGDQQLAPEWTNYRRRVQYQTCDVTSLVRQGANVVAAQLADGWYAGRLAGTRWSYDFPRCGLYGPNRRLLMRLDIVCNDGTRQTIVSDGTWKIALDGPIRSADHFGGETYDARKERPGWDQPGFDDAGWDRATVDGSIALAVTAQMNEPIRILQTFRPVAITEPKPGIYIFKLPQNIAGWCRVRLDGPAGTTISLRHAEWLKSDGTLFTEAYGGAASTDHFILDGRGPRVFEPHFTYHGFQYVAVTGLKSRPSLDTLEGCAVGSSAPVAGSFECSNPLLNQIWHNAFWSQRGNMHSVPTDCPNRDERYGYGGDALSFAETALFNMDMHAFFAKWTRDWREAQTDDGEYPAYCPQPWFFAKDRKDANTMGWSDAGAMIPLKVYEVYGDRRLLEEHYDSAKRYVGSVLAHCKDATWNVATCGDWLSVTMIKDVKGYSTDGIWTGLPNDVFGTAFAYASTRAVAKMAHILGHREEAAHYDAQAAAIFAAFQRHFVKSDGTIEGDNQSVYALALYFDLVPETLRPAAAARLVALIDKYDGRLTTGIMATPKLLEVLSHTGHDDVAYRLMESKRFPSLGFMVEQGATTVWSAGTIITPTKGSIAPA